MIKHQHVVVTITGTSPLICNRFTEEAAENATKGTRTSAISGNRGTPKEQAEPKLYLSDDKKPVIPQPNLFRCIIDAGKFFKAGRSKVTTQKSSLIPACVDIDGIEFLIVSKEGWRVDERPIVNPATGGRRLCYRPRFDDWSLTFEATVDPEIMDVKLFREIVDAAGKKIGLGDFRPDRKGPFGKFVVTRWEESEVDAPGMGGLDEEPEAAE